MMQRPVMRNLIVTAYALGIVGFVLAGLGFIGSTVTTDGTQTHLTAVGNPALVGVGVFLVVASIIPDLIGWVGGLVRTAQLRQWVWFILMLILGTIVTLIYAFIGSDQPERLVGNTPGSGYPPPPPPGYPPPGPYAAPPQTQ